MRTYQNPVIPGFHPDPSVCKSPEGYWLVNSTFEFFPGLPLYFSKDLVNWEQTGHVLDRESQLPLENAKSSQGLFAPTIRYHDGTFYVICTLISRKEGNFIVTSKDPRTGWSEPHWIRGADGIDPSLFFDDDGKCWYTGQRAPEPLIYDGNSEIWLQEIDLGQMKLTGEKTVIWTGAAKKSYWTEGPHLYKYDNMYYIVASEGGTDFEHAISVGRSQSIQGPYESAKRNPIFTHRNLGRDYPVACTGHSDFIQTDSGQWWVVMLGTRPYGGYYYNLGRETFLAPMVWQDGWPVICPDTGILPFEAEAPDLAFSPVPAVRQGFGEEELLPQWQSLIKGLADKMRLNQGILRILADGADLSQMLDVNMILRRQQHINCTASCRLEFHPVSDDSAAGLCVYQDSLHFMRIEAGKNGLSVFRTEAGVESLLHFSPFTESPSYVTLALMTKGQDYTLSAEGPGISVHQLQDGRMLSPFRPARCSFTGTMIGVYAKGSGKSDWAEFSDFVYKKT